MTQERTIDRCAGCGHEEPRSMRAIAQLAMGNALVFDCPECGHRNRIDP